MATAGPGPSTTAQALLLPGQPIPTSLVKDKPILGSGCYEQGGKILSSVVGRPRRDGAVSYPTLLERYQWVGSGYR
jgi:exosome complex RNA-binding protein Rrp4